MEVLWREYVGTLKDGTQASISGSIDQEGNTFKSNLCVSFKLVPDSLMLEFLDTTEIDLPVADINKKDGTPLASLEETRESCFMAHEIYQTMLTAKPDEYKQHALDMLNAMYAHFNLIVLEHAVKEMGLMVGNSERDD